MSLIKIKIKATAQDVKTNCWGSNLQKQDYYSSFYKENWELSFKKVVKKHTPKTQPNGIFFVNDNLPVHVAGGIKETRFNRFLSYSSNLNPIESLRVLQRIMELV